MIILPSQRYFYRLHIKKNQLLLFIPPKNRQQFLCHQVLKFFVIQPRSIELERIHSLLSFFFQWKDNQCMIWGITSVHLGPGFLNCWKERPILKNDRVFFEIPASPTWLFHQVSVMFIGSISIKLAPSILYRKNRQQFLCHQVLKFFVIRPRSIEFKRRRDLLFFLSGWRRINAWFEAHPTST